MLENLFEHISSIVKLFLFCSKRLIYRVKSDSKDSKEKIETFKGSILIFIYYRKKLDISHIIQRCRYLFESERTGSKGPFTNYICIFWNFLTTYAPSLHFLCSKLHGFLTTYPPQVQT